MPGIEMAYQLLFNDVPWLHREYVSHWLYVCVFSAALFQRLLHQCSVTFFSSIVCCCSFSQNKDAVAVAANDDGNGDDDGVHSALLSGYSIFNNNNTRIYIYALIWLAFRLPQGVCFTSTTSEAEHHNRQQTNERGKRKRMKKKFSTLYSSNEIMDSGNVLIDITCMRASTLNDMPCRNLFIVFPRMCILVFPYSPKNNGRAVPFAIHARTSKTHRDGYRCNCYCATPIRV